MTLIEKIKPYVVALEIGATTLTGCATNRLLQRDYAAMDEASKILKTSPSMIAYLPNGYKSSISTEMGLRLLAGIVSGTIEVKLIQEGNIRKYIAEGTYSQARNPEALEVVMEAADTNEDKIITREEEKALKMYIFEKVTNK